MRGLKSSGLILKGLRRGIRGDREQCSIEVLIEFSEGKVLGLGVENLEKEKKKKTFDPLFQNSANNAPEKTRF